MKSPTLKFLSMILLWGVFPATLQAQVWDEIQKSLFHPQAALEEIQLKQEVSRQAQNLLGQGLPGEIYAQKAAEGFAKGASPSMIRSALNETEQQLKQAGQLIQGLPGLNPEQKKTYAQEIFWALKRGGRVDEIRQLTQGRAFQNFRQELRALRENGASQNFNFKSEKIKPSGWKNGAELPEPGFKKNKAVKNHPRFWNSSKNPRNTHPLKDQETKQKHHPKK